MVGSASSDTDIEFFDAPAGGDGDELTFVDDEFIRDDDISDRAARKLSRYLEETERHMGMLLEMMPIGFALHQPQSIVFANQCLSDLLGVPENILVGRHCLDFILCDDPTGLIEKFNNVFEKGVTVNEPALTIENANGELRTVQLIAGCMQWDGQPLAQVLVQDVSHIKSLEKELHKRSQEIVSTLIRETEARKQQSEFISTISHEFRTPLSLIDGGAQMIDRMIAAARPEKIKDKTGKIRSAVARMSALIEDATAAVSMERSAFQIKPQRLNLSEMILAHADAIQEMSPTHRLDIDVSGLPETVFIDKRSCEHICENLLSNAIKYSPKADRICIRGRRSGGFAVVEIQDFGVGIPQKEMPNMFRRYFRASTSSGIAGTGIGLNLVKSLLDMQGGGISLKSELGEGTTFIVKIPIEPPRGDAKGD